jgi:hypothetical protein
VLTDSARDLELDMTATRGVLDAAYGAVVAEAFDLGFVLSHHDGLRSRNGVPRDASGILQRVAARIVALVRGGS